MSADDVHLSEMPWLPDDPDDEWPADDPALAAFAQDLRTIAAGPAPEPRPGLVAVMAQGASVPIDSSPGRRTKMLVKTLVGSLAAKLALGMGVAAASMTAAGAAGVLPDPAQHAMASVVSATTPFVLPDPSTVTPQVNRNSVTSTTLTTLARAGEVEAGDDDDAVPPGDVGGDERSGARADNHGACVSAVAKANAGTGSPKTVSSVARSDCGKTTESTTLSSSTSSSSTTSTTVGGSTTSSTSTTIASTGNRTSNSGPGSANIGNGNGNGNGNSGNGNGNSGKGNSGKD